MNSKTQNYDKSYSDGGFWNKVKMIAKKAGKEVIEKALWLYYAFQKPETPAWAKSTIMGALGYFIFPIDLIPDTVPILGYSDDLAVLVAAVRTVAVYITDDIKKQTSETLKKWFG